MKVDINKALEQIAEGLGVAVDKLYPVLYKQAYIDAAIDILMVLMWVGIIFFSVKGIKWLYRKYKSVDSWNDEWELAAPIGAFLLMVVIVVGALLIGDYIQDIITVFFNTDYYILKNILNQI